MTKRAQPSSPVTSDHPSDAESIITAAEETEPEETATESLATTSVETAAETATESAEATATAEEEIGEQPEASTASEAAAEPASEQEATTEGSAEQPAPGLSADQLARLRDTLIAANPNAVPELITGPDFDMLLASVDPAKEAYQRIAAAIAGDGASQVPRGDVRIFDPAIYEGLSGETKIAITIANGSGGHAA